MYYLEGVALDDPKRRWRLTTETSIRTALARAGIGFVVPGFDGETASIGSRLEPITIPVGLKIVAPSHGEAMKRVEFLLGLFGQRHKLLELEHRYSASESRYADAEVIAVANPTMPLPNYVQLNVLLRVPSGTLRSKARGTSSIDAAGGSGSWTIPALSGGTAPVQDSLVQFKGPLSEGYVRDEASGATLYLRKALSATEYAVVDSARWIARLHRSDSWALTSGTDISLSVESSEGAGAMLTLTPTASSETFQTTVAYKATNPGEGTRISVRAYKRYR